MTARVLKIADVDQADELGSQIAGILHCVRAVGKSDDVPDDAVSDALWAATALLDKLMKVIDGEAPK